MYNPPQTSLFFKEKMKMRKYTYLFVMMLMLASCGSRSQRLMHTVDGSIEDYNNGDSTTLRGLIILIVIIGFLWIAKQKDK